MSAISRPKEQVGEVRREMFGGKIRAWRSAGVAGSRITQPVAVLEILRPPHSDALKSNTAGKGTYASCLQPALGGRLAH